MLNINISTVYKLFHLHRSCFEEDIYANSELHYELHFEIWWCVKSSLWDNLLFTYLYIWFETDLNLQTVMSHSSRLMLISEDIFACSHVFVNMTIFFITVLYDVALIFSCIAWPNIACKQRHNWTCTCAWKKVQRKSHAMKCNYNVYLLNTQNF